MEAPPMGARSVKRPYHQQHPEETGTGTSFMVSGIHALLFDDDTLAAFINSPAALLPWNGDQSLLIDRYDVRHLLQDLSSVRKRRPAPPLTDATEEELNYERFRDLHDILSSAPQEEPQNLEESLNPSVGGYQAVPFSYSVDETENGTQTESIHRSVGFHPPFPVPDFLLSILLEHRFADNLLSLRPGVPPTEKLHQIIAGTAKFVKEHGGQSEVLLKVKQGSNPMFGFLNVDHHLHEYYRFLVQHPELLQSASQNKIAEPTQTTGEGLSLLGFAYGSGDDDDDRALRPGINQADVGAGSLGNTVLGQEGCSASDVCKASMDVGGDTAAQAKAVAASYRTVKVGDDSRSLKVGDDSRSKVTESFSKVLPQSNKKKKTLGGTELIQPNKRIVPQSKVSDTPAKVAANASNQLPKLPRKSESKTSSWHSVPSIKDMNYGMSADAAAAVVLAATRGARGLKHDSFNNKSSSSFGFSQKVQAANGQPVDSNGGKGIPSLGLGQSDVRLAKAVAELAAIAASHEADSADALLTPAEKLKAERLRKAKMFAAMIKSGKCGSESAEKPVEQLPGTSPAATSTKSNEMRTDGLCVNGKAIFANGKGVSIENSSLAEEVEESDINKSTGCGSADLASRHFKERKYRSKEQDPDCRSDSEESEHRRKRKDRKDDKKHKHSKRRKHKVHNSESADSGLSSGEEGTDERKSKTHRRHHHRRKRSHHERDDKDGKHEHSRHKSLDDDDVENDLSHKKHRHRRHRVRSSSGSEDEASPGRRRAANKDKRLRTASVEEQQLSSLASVTQGSVVDDQPRAAVTTEVPADIREKVRAMLLATL